MQPVKSYSSKQIKKLPTGPGIYLESENCHTFNTHYTFLNNH